MKIMPNLTAFRRLLPAAVMLCAVSLCACSTRTTKHMPHNEWEANMPQTLELRYVSLRYETALPDKNGNIRVTGKICPTARMPKWATHYDEGSLTVYGVDDKGIVHMEDVIHIVDEPINAKQCLPVRAYLKGTRPASPLYITMGYRLTLTDKSRSNRKTVFVAEDALNQ